MITLEEKKKICEEYKDRSNKVDEIAKRYGILRADVAHIAVEMGAEPRTKGYGQARKKKRGATVRTCPKCHKAIDIKGARFCYLCGADIRSNKELLIDRIHKAMRLLTLMPEGTRGEMQGLLLDIKSELSKEVTE